MSDWVYVVLIVIGFAAVCKIAYMLFKKRQVESEPATVQTQTTSCNRATNETGVMIYYANDHHGRSDREYRFNYKRVYDSSFNQYSWRAYIVRMPSLCGRDPDLHKTHRFTNGNGQYWVCWDSPVNSLKDMQSISRVWADSVQEYIATGKRFG